MKTLIALILLFLISHINAQQIFSGKVIDKEDQSPLIGATIISIDDTNLSTVTNHKGEFSILGSESAKSGLFIINYLGQEEMVVELIANKYLQLQMERTAYKMEAIVISSNKAVAEEFVSESITKLDIYTNPISRADPVRAVNALPFATNVDESANLSLRGSSPIETGYLLNEVPIHDAFRIDQINGVGQFSIFNTAIISQVDIFPSNPPLEYGNASSGLVSMYTDDLGFQNSHSINLTIAGFGANVSKKLSKRQHLVIYGNFLNDYGLKNINKKAFEDILGFRSIDAGLYTIYNLNEETSLKFFNYTLDESYEYNFEHPSTKDEYVQEKTKNLSVLNFTKKYNFFRVDINQGFDISKSKFTVGNINTSLDNLYYFGSINFSKIGENWSIKSGNSWDFRKGKVNGTYPIYDFALADEHPNMIYKDELKELNPEGYVYGKYNIKENLTIGGGLRWRKKNNKTIRNYRSAQFNTNYQIDTYQSINLGIGRYHKLAFPRGEYDQIHLISSDHASIEYKLNKEHLKLSASAYVKQSKFIDKNNMITGLEFFGSYETEKLRTTLSISSVNSTIEKNDLKSPGKYDISYFLRCITKLKLPSNFELNSVILFRQGSYFNRVEDAWYHEATDTYEPLFSSQFPNERLNDYLTLDLTVSKIFPIKEGSMVGFASVSNLTDRKNEREVKYNNSYEDLGMNYFNRRVLFLGCVYNW